MSGIAFTVFMYMYLFALIFLLKIHHRYILKQKRQEIVSVVAKHRAHRISQQDNHQ